MTLSLTNADCLRIVRDPVTGDIDSIDTSRGNLDEFEAKGWDFQVDWAWEIGPGKLRVNELLSYMDSYINNGSDYKGYTYGCIGCAYPEYKSVLGAFYNVGDWNFMGRWTHQSAMTDGNFGGEVAASNYFDASARWAVTDSLQITGIISNLTDEPPEIFPGAVFDGQYGTDTQAFRVLGRSFQVSARLRF